MKHLIKRSFAVFVSCLMVLALIGTYAVQASETNTGTRNHGTIQVTAPDDAVGGGRSDPFECG